MRATPIRSGYQRGQNTDSPYSNMFEKVNNKKEKALMDVDSSVVIAGGWRWKRVKGG